MVTLYRLISMEKTHCYFANAKANRPYAILQTICSHNNLNKEKSISEAYTIEKNYMGNVVQPNW